jgi:hypothetical protein
MTVRLKLLLRVCAVGSSLLLVAAFVAYRAAAASPPRPTPSEGELVFEKPDLLGGSKSMPIELLEGSPTPGEPRPRPRPRATATSSPEDEVIFSGSKSGIVSSKPARPAPTALKETDATKAPPSGE